MSEDTTKRLSLEEIRRMRSKTDWDRVKSAGDHEGPAEFEVDWSKARIEGPRSKTLISLRLDPDILDFFKGDGPGYQTRINAVLRSYMDAKKSGQA